MRRAGVPWRRHKRRRGHGDHVDTVDRAAGQAEFTAGTICGDDRVHALARTDDCVGRTVVEAPGTTDAGGFVDQGDELWTFTAAFRVERQFRSFQQRSQLRDHLAPTGGTAIQGTLTARQRLGIGAAAVEPATPALGLRQQRIDALRKHY